MFRKSSLSFLFTGVFIALFAAAAAAQTAPVRGVVMIKKADGTVQPVAGAVIDVYRTDISGSFPSGKSGKKGDFSFAGLPVGAVFIFSVSAPGASPAAYAGIRAGADDLKFVLPEGDGAKLSEADARKVAMRPGSGPATPKGDAAASDKKADEMTEEQKKAQAEYEAKVKEVNEKNAKAGKINEIVSRVDKEAKAAMDAKDYPTAIAKYQEGIEADPEFVGSAPVFYTNQAAALRSRAVASYNATVSMTDAEAKLAGQTAAKKDIAQAASDALKSWNVLKNAPAADIASKDAYENSKRATLVSAKETFRLAVQTEQVDPTVIDAAKVLIPEYEAVETDPAKKAEAAVYLADMYRVTGDSVNAIAAYKQILAANPSNLDAMAGAGLSLVNQGFVANDRNMLQEGADMLEKFVAAAPDTNKLKASAADSIKYLKEQNITPTKGSGRKKP